MRNEAESKALEIIQNLDEETFDTLAKMQRSSKWDYVGSNSKDSAEDAMWMRFHNGSFDIITCSTYGEENETYLLIQETNMNLSTLKSIAGSVIGFGDATSNGSSNPDTKEGLSSIIESIAFSLPVHGGNNEVVENYKIESENDLDTEFANIAERYEIPFKS